MEEPQVKIYDYHGRKNMCGDRIKIARAARKVSQADLAPACKWRA